jgi:hypothetical protein
MFEQLPLLIGIEWRGKVVRILWHASQIIDHICGLIPWTVELGFIIIVIVYVRAKNLFDGDELDSQGY